MFWVISEVDSLLCNDLGEGCKFETRTKVGKRAHVTATARYVT